MASAPDTNTHGHPISLLLVEDHTLTRFSTKLSLEKTGMFTVVGEAENGEVAIRLAEETQPQVILMDIGLPLMDGIRATQQIKTKFPQIKVIMLTSKDEPKAFYTALGAGADAYCMKDITIERLCMAIESVLDGVMWLDPAVARLVVEGLPESVMKDTATSKASDSESSTGIVEDSREQHLSDREIEILRLLVAEKDIRDIAKTFYMSIDEANIFIKRILNKLAVESPVEAAEKAVQSGLIKRKV